MWEWHSLKLQVNQYCILILKMQIQMNTIINRVPSGPCSIIHSVVPGVDSLAQADEMILLHRAGPP